MSNNVRGVITIKELTNEPGAIATIGNFKDHTDPKYIGPGTWNIIHRRSFKARNHNQQLNFIDEMNEICHGFPCTICRGHCTEYIKNHPMKEYLDVLVDVNGNKLALGMFIWTWKFHNAVNARIKKPIMCWDTAYNLYMESESLVCSKNCLEAEDTIPDGLEHDQPTTTVPILPEPKVKTPMIPTTQPTAFRMVSINRSPINSLGRTSSLLVKR